MDKAEWFEKIGEANVQKFRAVLKGLEDLSELKEYRGVFKWCGIYAVGSSLTKRNWRDIDITLVGVDFRDLWDYWEIFLRVPEALIEKEIVVPKEDERAQEEFTGTIDFQGIKYYFNRDKGKERRRNFLDTYCDDFIEPAKLLREIERKLEPLREKGGSICHNLNPLESYSKQTDKNFLVASLNVQPINLLVHGENLFVPYWKNYHEKNGLPFVVLKEWQMALDRSSKNWVERGARHLGLDYPYFIDPKGRKRTIPRN